MRTRTAKPLSELLAQVIKSMGIEGPFARGHIIATWENITSPQMKQHIERCWVKGNRLYVRVDSSSWRHELQLQREEWKARLNKELGSDLIREIIFR